MVTTVKKRKFKNMGRKVRKSRTSSRLVDVSMEDVHFTFQMTEREVTTEVIGQRVTVSPESFCLALSNILLGMLRNHWTEHKGLSALPSLFDMSNFIAKVFLESEMEYCCGIIGIVYIVRIIVASQISLNSCALSVNHSNWRSIVLSSLLVASKLYDDGCMSNEDFAAIFEDELAKEDSFAPGLTLPLLNRLELDFVKAVDFHLVVTAREYNLYACMVHTEIEAAKSLPALHSLERVGMSSVAGEELADGGSDYNSDSGCTSSDGGGRDDGGESGLCEGTFRTRKKMRVGKDCPSPTATHTEVAHEERSAETNAHAPTPTTSLFGGTWSFSSLF